MRWHPPGLLAPVLASLALALAAHPGAIAGESRPAAPVTAPRTAVTRHAPTRTLSSPGLVIGLDRESGAIGMPAPDEMARLRAQESRTTPPAPVVLPNGIKRLDARGWSREYFVVRRGADGRLAPLCVDGREPAARALGQTPPPPAVEEE